MSKTTSYLKSKIRNMKPFIETISLNEFYNDTSNALGKLANACVTTGFCFISNHGMDQNKIALGEESFREFLTKVPLEARLKYSYPETGFQTGYTPMKIETGEFAKTPDEKHFFHVHPGDMPYVRELPSFQYNANELWYEFHNLAKKIMKFMAISIDEFSTFFTSPGGEIGYSLLRGIHYPKGQKPVDDDEEVTKGGNALGMCASKHTDINMITLLLAREPGLQLWHNKQWVPITIADPDLIIMNCGDMLEHITNGRYKSGLHRVVCEPDKERFSIPFFYHVHNDFDISPLVQFGERKEKYKYSTAKEFLDHRLKQINLLK